MATKFVLAFWTKLKKISVVSEDCFTKTFKENGDEIRLCEGEIRTASIANKTYEAKILRICSSKKYLESLIVTKEGKILLHGAKPPAKELLAKRSKLLEDPKKLVENEKQILREITSNVAEESVLDTLGNIDGSTHCSHACPSCCSGSLPPFPQLPDGFVSTLVSLAEYFQKFQKLTEENTAPTAPSLSDQLNTWQWASPDKVELKKGTGVWIEAIKLEKILGQAQITKKPPHQTLVKSLLTHLLGVEKYIETTAERTDRRLLSAIVGFVNAKYPELAQPIERYYRCINLNRGYLMKRKNEVAFDNLNGEDSNEPGSRSSSRRLETVRSYRRPPEDFLSTSLERSERTAKRGRRKRSVLVGNRQYEDSNQMVIPLEPDFPIVSSDNIIIVPSDAALSSSGNKASTSHHAINTTFQEHAYMKVPSTSGTSNVSKDFSDQMFDEDSSFANDSYDLPF